VDVSCWHKVSLRSNNPVIQRISAVRMTKETSDVAMRSLDDRTLIQMTLAGHNQCFDALMDRRIRPRRRMW
jgi:hypothetical protein